MEIIEYLAEAYEKDSKLPPHIGKHCAGCEFKCSPEEEVSGSKSGFKECWTEALKWKDEDFEEPSIFELWDGRRKEKWIEDGILKLKDLTEDDIGFKTDSKAGLSRTERQMLQIEKVKNNDDDFYLDKEGLSAEMSSWKFPLHMIDFETSTVAIPFNKGRKSYEGIAFQFSHHKIYEDGRVEHASEFLNTERGVFPNFEFVRALMKSLGSDQGTIFRYSAHENTFLNQIYWQLMNSDESDKETLCSFIKTITKSTSGSPEKWEGHRQMVDLLECVKAYYYDPYTKGSNSIKYVLPAILRSSEFLQQKYSKPIYGTDEYPSRNFSEKTWLQIEDGEVVDPYKQLDTLFEDINTDSIEILSNDESIANGGAALTAYAKMQFTEMEDIERDELKKGLLKYCELDTLAMAMIYEAWREWLNGS